MSREQQHWLIRGDDRLAHNAISERRGSTSNTWSEMRQLERMRTSGWQGVAIYIAIALFTLVVLAYLFKKMNPAHLTKGALMVMLMYLTAGAFMLLASRLFTNKRAGQS